MARKQILGRFGWACWLLAVTATATGNLCSAQDRLDDRVRSLAQPFIDAEILVGISIGVIQGDKQTDVHLGQIRSGGMQPDADTVYEIGSVSKVFTGMLLADAVNRGEVKLDQAAQELMPDGVTMPKWKDREITLVELATHASGLPRLGDNMPSLNTDNPYADYTSKLAGQFLSRHQLARAPGSKYEYSNLGMSYAAFLVCSNAGGSYDDLLTKRLAEPLGMSHTRVAMTEPMKARLATPHIAPGKTTGTWDFADLPGAGGIRSSTRDMLRLAAACLDPPEGDVGRAIELSWRKHRPGRSGEFSMGLGWHVAHDGSTHWHNGQTGGSHGMLMINRNVNAAVVAISNTASMEVDQLAEQILRMLTGAMVQPRKFEASVQVAPEVMNRYVGRYQLAPNFIFTVSIDKGKLMVGVTKQPTLQVFPRSETEWFYRVVDATLTFQVDDDGKCNELELFQNGIRQQAKRIE